MKISNFPVFFKIGWDYTKAMLEDIKRKKAARKAAKLARMAAAKGEAAAPAAEESPKGKAKK